MILLQNLCDSSVIGCFSYKIDVMNCEVGNFFCESVVQNSSIECFRSDFGVLSLVVKCFSLDIASLQFLLPFLTSLFETQI